ncbi:hypothetical protein [Sphingopyxis witflariensis]|uniref:hypothetical protein n=1 Tax=Sphingopyxis witflariensis TaxID=173675 RepID=UPI00191C6FFC|nr:hypothetical protein [Sphingopyxis witflariensis]
MAWLVDCDHDLPGGAFDFGQGRLEIPAGSGVEQGRRREGRAADRTIRIDREQVDRLEGRTPRKEIIWARVVGPDIKAKKKPLAIERIIPVGAMPAVDWGSRD